MPERLAKVIPLFGGEKPPTVDTEWWRWGREEFVDGDKGNALEQIVADILEAQSETALRSALQELKDEVNAIPGLD